MNKIDGHKIKFPSKHFTYISKNWEKESFLLIVTLYSCLRMNREHLILLINFDKYNLKFLGPE